MRVGWFRIGSLQMNTGLSALRRALVDFEPPFLGSLRFDSQTELKDFFRRPQPRLVGSEHGAPRRIRGGGFAGEEEGVMERLSQHLREAQAVDREVAVGAS